MQYIKRVAFMLTALAVPLLYGDSSLAAPTTSVTQELKVTARVLTVRHIILNQQGDIIRITSNTLEDIVPTAYISNDASSNRIPLSDSVYSEYRVYVPIGTAQYGVLYENLNPVFSPAKAGIKAMDGIGIIKNVSFSVNQLSYPNMGKH